MSLSPIEATCSSCKHKFTAVPRRSFLGFQRLNCPACAKSVLYPLTSGYRTTYKVLLGLMVLAVFGALAKGDIAFPGVLGIAAVVALLKDRGIKKRVNAYLCLEKDTKISIDASSLNDKIKCNSCGHFSAINNSKCLYCGADLAGT